MGRLIGDDGAFASFELAATQDSGDIAAGHIVEIVAKGSSSVLGPGGVGDLFINDTGAAVTLGTGDECKPLSQTLEASVVGWNMEFDTPDIDMTALADAVQVIRLGRPNANGSVTVLQEVKDDKFLSRVVPMIDFTQATPAKRVKTTDKLGFIGYLAYQPSDDKRMFLHLPAVNIGGGRLGAQTGNRQEAEYQMRVAADDVVGRGPTLYIYSHSG